VGLGEVWQSVVRWGTARYGKAGNKVSSMTDFLGLAGFGKSR
jgi:hypothetical protein